MWHENNITFKNHLLWYKEKQQARRDVGLKRYKRGIMVPLRHVSLLSCVHNNIQCWYYKHRVQHTAAVWSTYQCPQSRVNERTQVQTASILRAISSACVNLTFTRAHLRSHTCLRAPSVTSRDAWRAEREDFHKLLNAFLSHMLSLTFRKQFC